MPATQHTGVGVVLCTFDKLAAVVLLIPGTLCHQPWTLKGTLRIVAYPCGTSYCSLQSLFIKDRLDPDGRQGLVGSTLAHPSLVQAQRKAKLIS